MSNVAFNPSVRTNAFGAARIALNDAMARFAHANTDVDEGGRVFAYVMGFSIAMLVARWSYVASVGAHSEFADDALLVFMAPLAYCASLLARRLGLVEAEFVMRAGTFLLVASPCTSSMVIDVFHTGRGFALMDDALAAADRSLGFDWIAYAHWFDDRPWAWSLSILAYGSIIHQFAFAILVLCFMRSAPRLYVYLCAQISALTLVAFVSIFLPAIGAYEQSGAAHVAFHHHDFQTADAMTSSIMWLRGAATGPDGVTFYTLISFPSYHAVTAVLFTYAYWRTPYLRWIGLALNLAMLAATPLQGSHYFVDVLCGMTIAILCLIASTRAVAFVATRTCRARTVGPHASVVAPASLAMA